MRKAEIACYKQFLIFSQCFPQLYILSQNAALSGNGLTVFPHETKFGHVQIECICRQQINFTKMIISAFDKVENIVGKGQNASIHNVFKGLLFQDC